MNYFTFCPVICKQHKCMPSLLIREKGPLWRCLLFSTNSAEVIIQVKRNELHIIRGIKHTLARDSTKYIFWGFSMAELIASLQNLDVQEKWCFGKKQVQQHFDHHRTVPCVSLYDNHFNRYQTREKGKRK